MADRTFGPYPGLTVVGGGKLAALYGVNGGVGENQGTGVQHLFLGDYCQDLVHTAATLLRFPDGTLAYGNRLDDGQRHPLIARPERVFNRYGYAWGSSFTAPVRRTEVVTATAPACLSFECTVEGPFHGDVAALVVFQGWQGATLRTEPRGAQWSGPDGKQLRLTVEGEAECLALVADSPSGFLYRTVQALQAFERPPAGHGVQMGTSLPPSPLGVTIGRAVTLGAGETLTFRWHLGTDAPGSAGSFWENWYEAGGHAPADPVLAQWYRANLAALRGAVMTSGFVPADMSGQYFSGGSPSYYARDALMVARALLLAGHSAESAAIVRYLAERPAKRGGEFCQRYNAAGEPAEGQHNGVPHQLDSQGYFAWNVVEHFRRTGNWLVPFAKLAAALDVLADCVGSCGMVGPEGGVNEGVYGPAYITSTNMSAYGGLLAGIHAAQQLGESAAAMRWQRLAGTILQGIEAAWDERCGRYHYGYVTYDASPVRQYDTPQYFGPLYGFPLTDRMLQNDWTLRKQAAFFGRGIGYSEQSYHDGPWIFTSAACAQFQALAGNWNEYEARLQWLMAHSNQYGLMPEAIDSADQSRCFVNPLVWGCAEAVAAVAIASEQPPGGRTYE